MKIHSAIAQGSKIVKAFSLFPFVGFSFSLMLWFNNKSSLLLLAVGLFFFLFIYTLLFAKQELYIDTETKTVIKKIRWLFINTKTEFPLSSYKGIYISLGRTVAKNNYGSLKSTQFYNVVLVHKYATTDTAYGMNIMENFLLQHHIKSTEEAKEIALEFSKILGIDVIVEEQLAKTHPNLLKHGRQF